MTEPRMPAIQLNVNTQERAEGVAWVAIEIGTPLNFYSVAFPIEQAEAIADHLPGLIKKAIAECERLASGLVIANSIPKE